jgi:SAM-dependent methyltransferase
MGIDRSKRLSFEKVADLYAESCIHYPDELAEDTVSLSGIPDGGRILEIGCGPGNATALFAKRGFRILCLELGQRLAALAVNNCRIYNGVEIRNVAFEDWELESNAFDLVMAADSFHWIAPEIGYPRAAKALKDSGSAAFFWSVPIDPQTDWSREIENLYKEIAPNMINPDRRFTPEWMNKVIMENFRASDCFEKVTVKEYSWFEEISAEKYIKRLKTFSMHHGMNQEVKNELYAKIFAVIERYGGKVMKPQSVMLFHAKVKG